VKFRAYFVWAAVAVGSGIIVLLGYFIDNPTIISLRLAFMRWAVLLAAASLFLGLYNLLKVHWIKVGEQKTGWFYSAILILTFLTSLVLGLMFRPDNPVILILFNYVQLPIETSLMGLLAVSLLVAGFRLVSRRQDLSSLVFVGTALLVLLGTGPWLAAGESDVNILFGQVTTWISQVWASAGARGILLGVALGAILSGLRVLLVIDRPYGD
jgi:hypothetical protein